jgi:hypothetical protein
MKRLNLTKKEVSIVVKCMESVLASGGTYYLNKIIQDQSHGKKTSQCKLVAAVIKKLDPTSKEVCPDC